MTHHPCVGGVYSIRRHGASTAAFGVAKVIALAEPSLVCLRIYCGQLPLRPRPEAFPAWERAPGVLDEVLQVSEGAFLVTAGLFGAWEPEFLFAQAVTEEEAERAAKAVDCGEPYDDEWGFY